MIKINNINDLVNLIEKNELSDNQLIEVVEKSLNVFVNPLTTKCLLTAIKDFWNKYGNLPLSERPLFLDESQNDFETILQSPTAKKINDKLEAYY